MTAGSEPVPAGASPSLQARIRSLLDRARSDGWRATSRHVAQRLWQEVYTEQTLYVLSIDLTSIVTPARHGRVRLKDLEPDDLPALRELNRRRGDLRADARFQTDLRTGYRAFIGLVDDQPIGHYWWSDYRLATPHYDIADYGLEIALGEGDTYGSNLYVDPGSRRGGVATDFLYQIESTLRDRGYRQIWGYVVADNQPARWLYGARGYEPRWKVTRRRVLGRWHARVSPLDAETKLI